MVQQVKERIQTTKKYLRKQTLHTILEQFDDQLMKLSKKDRRVKYDKMKQNPYSFFRGSAYLFYYDVTTMPFSYHTPIDKPTWVMGDLHFDNFSAFQNEDEDIVFDVDDFDEGYVGSYLFDVLRMVVSIRLLGEQQGFHEEEQDQFVEKFLKSYYKQLRKFVSGDFNPVTTQFTVDHTKGPVRKTLKKLELRKATHELDKQTSLDEHGNRKFDRENIKLDSISNNEYKEIIRNWEQYIASLSEETFKGKEHYQIKDIVKKSGAGIGSTGLKRFYILIEGQHNNAHHDDIILEVKEARAPVPAYFFPYSDAFWEVNNHQGKRVIATQKAMHHKADPYLGYLTMQNRDYYVRERSAYEKDLKPKQLVEYKSVKQTVKSMGKITAKIHARADEDIEHGLLEYHSETEIIKAIGNNVDGFFNEMIGWSKFYKERVEQDYLLFNEWLEEYFYKKN
ncbi:DUF2252 domain-containing protein [Aquibacillus koreensis]|uniref:DUF2252 domain-containing protein n=1 Tax=Aquibacillus koreensis TaxID=279446 RepID=A0A9X4AK80_9BACI|nr:DUF2252 domain-containing protein [Aquibacillus koreensis]MCT2536093.1 DUF2252 domain-containing protein [Aquibacillus koreensis]MDC3422801.1 DUF2252 domain-containing protein [Aquibacillus koreensis]